MKDARLSVANHSASELRRPLSVLLSQVLVAFTVELDNEFERLMGEAGYPGAGLSLVVWLNGVRFLAQAGPCVQDLAARALAQKERMVHQLGCLERWGFIVLKPGAKDKPSARREGWGSGRGIRSDWLVNLTLKGQKAAAIWPGLLGQIEERWIARFGAAIIRGLRKSLQAVVGQLEMELPYGLPWDAQMPPRKVTFPNRSKGVVEDLALPILLSQALHAFAMEFDTESKTSLALCANTLRVLGEGPIRIGDIPHLTGASPETSGVGWQLKPYVVIEADPNSKRGKRIRLGPLGQRAKRKYIRLAFDIEKRWETRFGEEVVQLRDPLRELFEQSKDGRPLLSIGLTPPVGVRRAGAEVPSLGRRIAGPAWRQRTRDIVAQTEAFMRDPPNALPHYPLWDMNRGFGP
jgi:hypothetical protein